MSPAGWKFGPRILTGALRRLARDRLPIDYLLGRARASLPSRISLELTYRCNASCPVCCQSGAQAVAHRASAKDSGFLDPLLVERLAREVRHWAPTFYLTGGEPLLHPAIVDVVSIVKKRGMYCSLNTNGSRLSELGPSLAGAGIDKIIISVDVSRADYERSRSLSYDRMREGVRRLLAESRRRGRPRLSLNCVVSPGNYASLSGIKEVARDLGVSRVSIQHLMFSSPSLIKRHARLLQSAFEQKVSYVNAVENTSAMDASLLAGELRALTNGDGGLKVTVSPEMSEEVLARYYSAAEAVIPGRCIAPWTTAVVMPTGDLSICPPLRIGNLGSHSLKTLWNGPPALRFRRWITREGLLPDCSRCCARQFTVPRR